MEVFDQDDEVKLKINIASSVREGCNKFLSSRGARGFCKKQTPVYPIVYPIPRLRLLRKAGGRVVFAGTSLRWDV